MAWTNPDFDHVDMLAPVPVPRGCRCTAVPRALPAVPRPGSPSPRERAHGGRSGAGLSRGRLRGGHGGGRAAVQQRRRDRDRDGGIVTAYTVLEILKE